MVHKSGCKVEATKNGVELTYFGVFSSCIPSQTLKIRNWADLADILQKLGDAFESKEREEGLTP